MRPTSLSISQRTIANVQVHPQPYSPARPNASTNSQSNKIQNTTPTAATKFVVNSSPCNSRTLPRMRSTTAPVEPPIVVNMSEVSLTKSSLEEKANKAVNSPLKHKQTTSPLVVGGRHMSPMEHNSYPTVNEEFENYSQSLPIRGKNQVYSIDPSTVPNHSNRQRAKTSVPSTPMGVKGVGGLRQCSSQHSSPAKRGRGSIPPKDRLSHIRAASLDRDFNRRGFHGSSSEENELERDFGSHDSISSKGTVENFERQLVSKIAERFAIEDELTYLEDASNSIGQEFYIDDDLESIGAEILSNDALPGDDFNVAPIDESRVPCSRTHNEVIKCDRCIGDCNCQEMEYDIDSPFYKHDDPIFFEDNYQGPNYYDANIDSIGRFEQESSEDTDERTDSELR